MGHIVPSTHPTPVCCSVTKLSDSLWLQGLQHSRLPCPSLSPRVCSNSCLLNRWFYLTILSSVIPFSSCPQSFLASGFFQWVGSSHQVYKILELQSASVLPMNVQGWFPLGLISLISLLSKGLSIVFSSMTIRKHQFFGTQPSLWSNSHLYMTTTGKTKAWTIQTFVSKVRSHLFLFSFPGEWFISTYSK